MDACLYASVWLKEWVCSWVRLSVKWASHQTFQVYLTVGSLSATGGIPDEAFACHGFLYRCEYECHFLKQWLVKWCVVGLPHWCVVGSIRMGRMWVQQLQCLVHSGTHIRGSSGSYRVVRPCIPACCQGIAGGLGEVCHIHTFLLFIFHYRLVIWRWMICIRTSQMAPRWLPW